jgi:hypothetical protein
MRKLTMRLAFCSLLLATAAPAWAEDDLASLQERLQVTEDTIQQLETRWSKLSQELADPNVMVSPKRFEQIRVDQVRQLADLAFKLAREHPNVVTALQKAYPKEFALLNENGISLADLSSPAAAFLVQGPLEMLLTSQLPQVKKDYAEHLRKEHDQARKFLEDRKAEILAQIAALKGGQQPGTTTDTAGGTDAGSTGGTDTGSTGGTDTGSTDGTDTGSTGDGTDTGQLPPVTKDAVTAGGDGTDTGPKPAPGSQPFETAALENQIWPGTWDAECKDGAGGNAEKKSGAAEFRFAGRTATITIKGDGDPLPLTVQMDPQGAFFMHQGEQGGEFAAAGQFQNFDYGDGSYAPHGKGTYSLAIDFSFLADAVASALTLGAASEAELTPQQREANTMRCKGNWELPLPG